MHDPSTVAFEIKYPWFKTHKTLGSYRHWANCITVWHEDPETDGTDDSCGWSYPRLSKADIAWAEKTGKDEWRAIFNPEWSRINLAKAGPLEVVLAARMLVHRYLSGRRRYREPSIRDVRCALHLVSNPVDNLRNSARDARRSPKEFGSLLLLLLRIMRRERRWWFQHPRWHVHHWHLQIHTWQTFRRWALTRCAGCGKRFSWGYSPVSGQWDRDRPGFLRGEQGLYHQRCYPGGADVAGP